MNGRRLILKDQTTIENGECGLSGGRLWCWLPEFTMAQAAALFFDPEKTDRITFEYGEMQEVYEGFTNCVNLFTEVGQVSVCMTRGESGV